MANREGTDGGKAQVLLWMGFRNYVCMIVPSHIDVYLERRWCPIFKAIVAGFRGKVA